MDNDKVVLPYTTVLNEIAFLFDSKVHILHIKTALMCKKKKPTEGAIIKWMLGSTIQDTNLDKAIILSFWFDQKFKRKVAFTEFHSSIATSIQLK